MSQTKRKQINIEEKSRIISKLEKGIPNKDLAKEYGVPHSTISNIWKEREKIKILYDKNFLKMKRARTTRHTKIEEALLKWFKYQRINNVPINGPILQQKANDFAQLFGEDFVCSSSWIQRFRARHGIVGGKMSGEAACVDKDAVVICAPATEDDILREIQEENENEQEDTEEQFTVPTLIDGLNAATSAIAGPSTSRSLKKQSAPLGSTADNFHDQNFEYDRKFTNKDDSYSEYAVPKVYIKEEPDQATYGGLQCNECSGDIIGFRYTCVQCADYDLCSACEARGAHARHYVLRVPGPRPHLEVLRVVSAIRRELFGEAEEKNLAYEPEIFKIEVKEEFADPLDDFTASQELHKSEAEPSQRQLITEETDQPAEQSKQKPPPKSTRLYVPVKRKTSRAETGATSHATHSATQLMHSVTRDATPAVTGDTTLAVSGDTTPAVIGDTTAVVTRLATHVGTSVATHIVAGSAKARPREAPPQRQRPSSGNTFTFKAYAHDPAPTSVTLHCHHNEHAVKKKKP